MSRTDFGSHVYWRVQCYIVTGTSTALTAVLFRDGSGSSIAATGGSAIESGHQSTFDSSKLFDGTDATFWESTNTGSRANPWAGYQFGSGKTVMQMAVQKAASMDGSGPPSSVSFEYSDDGIVWAQAAYASLLDPGLTNDVPSWFDFSMGGLNP